MSDNPFSEPDDSDRTVIRPAPGGRRAAPQPQAAPPQSPFQAATPPQSQQRAPAPIAAEGAENISFGLNPLISAAAPLLQLIGRLRNTYSQPDPGDLRERALRQIGLFERTARDARISDEEIIKARYALCASIDDVAQNMPWGTAWASRPLVASFREGLRGYEGIASGVGFFQLLTRAEQQPGTELALLQLKYLCLSLGFLGELRAKQRPMAELDRVRENLFAIIVGQQGAPDPALSPHWPGVQAPYRPARAVVPTWVMGAAALAILGALFVWFSTGLNAASDDAFAQLLGAPMSKMPQIVRAAPVKPPPPPPQAPAPDPLYVFLKPEIDLGLVSVLGDHAMPIVRIRNTGMFASGSATVAQSYYRLLQRIGEALKAEKGPVTVDGYTDNQPIKTVQFPSNFQLSQARADAAKSIIARALGDPGRITAQGHADADPIASNATSEGRDQNRRIEVVLRRQG
jgi:type VI secretion system protein ImpK